MIDYWGIGLALTREHAATVAAVAARRPVAPPSFVHQLWLNELLVGVFRQHETAVETRDLIMAADAVSGSRWRETRPGIWASSTGVFRLEVQTVAVD